MAVRMTDNTPPVHRELARQEAERMTNRAHEYGRNVCSWHLGDRCREQAAAAREYVKQSPFRSR